MTVPLTLKLLFSSKLRVKVLSHFFFHPGEVFHVRGLAAELRESAGSVARELANLEKAGIVEARPVGNQKQCRLRQDNPILDELRNLFLKASGASAELKAVLAEVSGVEAAFLYGSFASGEAHVASDIDLMVIGDVTERELAPAVARVERHLNRRINYVVYTREEVARRRRKRGDFIHEVLAGPRIVLIGDRDG